MEIIKKYEKHLAYWVSEKDKGQYYAVQKGFEKSTGEIMTYLNSDDILYKQSLFTIAQIFTDYPQIEWVSGLSNNITEQDQIVWVSNLQKWNKFRYYQNDYKFIQQEGTFWKRSLWQKIGSTLNLNCVLVGDLALWLSFFQYAEIHHIHTVIAAFRLRTSNQKSLELYNDYVAEAEQVLKNFQIKEADAKELQKVQYWQNIQKKLQKIPIIRYGSWFCARYYENSPVFQFPQSLVYHRNKQKFVLQ